MKIFGFYFNEFLYWTSLVEYGFFKAPIDLLEFK